MSVLSAAWAARASTQINVVHIGDSVTDGTGASTFEAKYTTRLLRALQTDAGISGGPGLLNPYSFAPGANSLSSFWSPVAPSGGGFLKGGQWNTDQAVTLTFTGTRFSLHFFKGFSTATNFTISIDGGSAITVTVPTTGGQNNQGVYTSSTLASGSHTVLMTPAPGAQLFIRGAHIYDGDYGKGIHGWEGGHFGTTTTIVEANVNPYYADALAVIQPQLVTLMLGLNDQTNSIGPATFQSNVTSIISQVNALCTTPPSWVLAGPYVRSGATVVAPSTDYLAALQTIAAADPTNRRAVDLTSTTIPTADGTHPTDTGHSILAAKLEAAVLDLAGVSAPPSGSGAWSTVTSERWSGSAWVPMVAERWSGSAWVPMVAERAN